VTEDVEKLFEEAGALLKGHFRLASGLHSPVYWEKCRVLQYPEYTEKLCKMIADHYRDRNVQVVAAPTTPGIIMSYEVARQLGLRGIFAEKADTGGRIFRRGFKIDPGERVLIVDDIFTRGGSIREVISAVKELDGDIVGVGVLVDRSPEKVELGVPFFSCHKTEVITYEAANCPLCAQGIPLVTPGSSAGKSN
jgi:orotate phosphoribosyltransferase